MSFLLSDIEKHVGDKLIIEAEQLVEQNRIAPVKELEKHLWFTTVNDDKAYEVEVQITPSKVKAFSCDCGWFKLNRICKHIVAALFLVRTKKTEQTKKKKAKKVKKKLPKLSVPVLLSRINEADLKNFVREYARNNRSFAISLKARFAQKIEVRDNFEKYSDILKAAIGYTKKSGGKIKDMYARHLYETIRELLNQVVVYLELQNYQDAFLVLQALLKHLPPASAQADQNNTLKNYIDQCLNKIQTLCREVKSPELKEAIRVFCFEELNRPFYLVYQFEEKLIDCLLELNSAPEKYDLLLEFLATELHNSSEGKRQAKLLLYSIRILEFLNRKQAAQELIKENLHNQEVLAIAIKYACEEKNFEYAEQLARQALKNASNAIERKLLEKTLLSIALDLKNKKLILQYARLCFFHDFEINYFQLCKKYTSENWPEFRENLLLEMDRHPYSLELRNAKAEVFFMEKMYPELIQYIQKISSLNLLQKFDDALFHSCQPEVEALYKTLLSDYLQNHLGRQAAVKVREVLQHLNKLGQATFTEKLIRLFKTDYAKRHALIEELNTL